MKLYFVNPNIYKQIKNDKPDIIHTIGLRSFQSLMAWFVSKQTNIPLVVSDQGGLTTHPFLKQSGIFFKLVYKIQNFFIKCIINDSSAISAANEYEKEIFLTFNKNSKIKIIRNGINLKTLVSQENFKQKYKIDNKFILFVGRFSKSKGIETLLYACSIIKNELKIQNVSLVIMGVDFGYQHEMLKLINMLKLNDNVIVIKNPPRDDVVAAYGQSEFLVLPSHWELSPLVPLESFAFKKPVISTKAHGIPYTVQDKVNGLLVEPDNPNDLSKAMIYLLENKDLREKLGLSGYEFVHKECNCVSMAQNSLALYQEIRKNNPNK